MGVSPRRGFPLLAGVDEPADQRLDRSSEKSKKTKRDVDSRVERSLYERANGYNYETVKIFMPAGAKKPVYAPYVEHVPPGSSG
jgi:hypothetical protein